MWFENRSFWPLLFALDSVWVAISKRSDLHRHNVSRTGKFISKIMIRLARRRMAHTENGHYGSGTEYRRRPEGVHRAQQLNFEHKFSVNCQRTKQKWSELCGKIWKRRFESGLAVGSRIADGIFRVVVKVYLLSESIIGLINANLNFIK